MKKLDIGYIAFLAGCRHILGHRRQGHEGACFQPADGRQRAVLDRPATRRRIPHDGSNPDPCQSNIIEAGDDVYPLPKGDPITIGTDVDAYMKAQRTAGLVIVQDGKIRLEKYGLGFSGDGKWTSFSVAKSFTSTLVGAAIKDGYIKSIEDKVSAYIPDLKGSAMTM